MPTNFPASQDDLTSLPNPTAGSYTNNPSHAGLHDNENDSIRAIEAKIGIGASTPATGQVFKATGTGTSGWAALAESDVTNLVSDLAAKAPLISPALSGIPTTPTAAANNNSTQIASTAYVDSATAVAAQGLNSKPSVAAVSTSNIASLSGAVTVDGQSLVAGQRVLLTGQTTASQNGLWVVNSGAWTRPTDFATGSSQVGSYVFVETGTVNASSGWNLSGTATITVDTTAQTWVQINGLNDVIAGTGLSKSGNTMSLTTPVSVANGGTGSTTQNFVDLTTAQTIAGIKTFSSAPVVPSSSFPESAVTNLVSDLAAKATDTAVVHLAGVETVTGAKTFNAGSLLDKGNQVYNVAAYGAVGDGVTDDTVAIRNAMNAAFNGGGGTLLFAAKTYYINTSGALTPVLNGNTSVTVPLIFQGQGMNATILKMGPNATGGIFNNSVPGGGTPNVAQITVQDLTLDGNYSGVNTGAIAQPASNPAGQLVTLPAPYTSAGTPTLNGLYHIFNRVRFYRPSGFTFQGFTGILNDCVFDQCGQPDKLPGGLHWDSIGNGDTVDVIVNNCTWTNSSGNYADFTIVPAGKTGRLTMVGCKSFNHQIGGIYALGTGSVIAGNRLENVNTGSGVGYDVSTIAGNRSNNLVFGNTLKNMTVNASGLSTANGDSWYGNIATDSTVMQINGINAADISTAQTLTNKTINGNNNTLTVLAASQLSGVTPVANGGTGSSTQNFVDLTTAQNIAAGAPKTFGTNTDIGTNTPIKIIGFSNTQALQEWGDGSGVVYLRVFRSSGNVMSLTSSSVLGLPSVSVNGYVQVAGSISTAFAAKTAAYTLTNTDSIISVDATSAAFTVTLPDATTCTGRQYTIKKIDSSANAVTLATTPNTQTIDGVTTKVVSGQWTVVKLVSNGVNWLVV